MMFILETFVAVCFASWAILLAAIGLLIALGFIAFVIYAAYSIITTIVDLMKYPRWPG